MSRLSIRHTTDYLYEGPVAFGPWRLMMRPLDSHAIRVVEASLEFTPAGATRWASDPYGNSICWFQPSGMSDRLTVVNRLVVERYPAPLPDPGRFDFQSTTLIFYDADGSIVLEPYMRPAAPYREDNFLRWLGAADGAQHTLASLQQLNARIHTEFKYGARFAEGVQSPGETVALGTGTCRDFAWLMIESARHMGLAARFVTGYLFSPNAGTLGAGATHAWCDVFVPQLGWVEFDPTNGLMESPDLIRVAATRTLEEASPMAGSAMGTSKAEMKVEVTVEVTVENAAPTHISFTPSVM